MTLVNYYEFIYFIYITSTFFLFQINKNKLNLKWARERKIRHKKLYNI